MWLQQQSKTTSLLCLGKSLVREYPRTATLYLLPKVHKYATIPPGRPIVSGSGSLCEPTCRFIDYHLKPLVETLPSYLKDTNNVLRKIEYLQLEINYASSYLWCRSFIYINMSLWWYSCFSMLFTDVQSGFWSCAPSYANLFLGLWESGIFCTEPVSGINQVQYWGRYIDDILLIWQGTSQDLESFVQKNKAYL